MRKGIWGFALVAIMLLMASCSSKSEYANAIPKDAAMVMSFDFKTMAEKSGINGKGGEKVVAKLTDALKSGLEGEAYKTAELFSFCQERNKTRDNYKQSPPSVKK